MITLTDINKILEVLLDKETPKIAMRAFRQALPSILARERASEEMLKALAGTAETTFSSEEIEDEV